ncbi:MAG: LPXTG cell wall anchor domain-containing protein [Rubrobacter sp.]
MKLRKVMLLAAMLAMVLAAAAPVFAQDDNVVIDDSGNTDVQYVDCSQVQAAVQAQYGDANAIGDENVAAVASEQGITQNQVNACLGEVNGVVQAGEDVNVDVEGSASAASDDDDAAAAAAAAAAAGGSSAAADASAAAGSASAASSASAATELPETGGASLLALGAGALLVAGGLLARRIVR